MPKVRSSSFICRLGTRLKASGNILRFLGYLLDFFCGAATKKQRLSPPVFDWGQLQRYQQRYDLEVVWDMMVRTEGTEDSVRELRSICDALLESNPDNAAFLLLRAFTRCLHWESDPGPFQSDFRRGWEIMQRMKHLSRLQYLHALSRY